MNQATARAVVLDRAFESPDLDLLLEASKGERPPATEGGMPETVYRPLWTAATLWRSSKNTRRLLKGEGAEFGTVADTIAGLMATQAVLDQDVTVPPGYEAVVPSSGVRASPGSVSVPTRVDWS